MEEKFANFIDLLGPNLANSPAGLLKCSLFISLKLF